MISRSASREASARRTLARVTLRLAASAVLAATLSTFACSSSAAPTHSPARPVVAHSGAVLAPRMTAAPALRPTASLAALNGFLASVPADGGASVLLPDGRVLWLFGDTWDTGARNSAAIQSGSKFVRLPGTFYPGAADGYAWYWPGEPALDGGRLVVPMARLLKTGSGAWDWKGDGVDVVTYDASTLKVLRVVHTTGGAANLARNADGSTWVLAEEAVSGSYGKRVVGRLAPKGKLGSPGAWGATREIIHETAGAGSSVAFLRSAKGFTAWTKSYDLIGKDVVRMTAPAVVGPWSAPAKAFTPPVDSGQWSYAVEVHPEQVASAGRVVLTYAVNGDGATGSGAYHLYAVEVAK